MLRSYDIVVLDEPKPWHRAGRNNKTGASFKKQVDKDVQHEIRREWMSQWGQLELIPRGTGVRLAVTAFLPAPKSMSGKRRRSSPLPTGVPDVDNLIKQVKDALNGVAWVDDSQVVTVLGRKRYALGSDGEDTMPRWVITVEVIDDVAEANSEGHFAGVWGVDEPDYGGTGTSVLGGRPGPG